MLHRACNLHPQRENGPILEVAASPICLAPTYPSEAHQDCVWRHPSTPQMTEGGMTQNVATVYSSRLGLIRNNLSLITGLRTPTVALLSCRRRSAGGSSVDKEIIYVCFQAGKAVVVRCFSTVMNRYLCTLVVLRELLLGEFAFIFNTFFFLTERILRH